MENMRTRKTRTLALEKSLDDLSEKLADCAVLAKAQRATADKQHESAYKLEGLGQALKRDVADIKSELDGDPELNQSSAARNGKK
jgi:hypothetical protein